MNYEQRMRLKYNIHASSKAFSRLETALEKFDNHEIYAAIGELLLWVMNIHEWHKTHGLADYENRRNSNENGKTISGLAHAYNSLKHNMMLFTIHYKKDGFSFTNFSFSELDFEPDTVRWIKAGELLNGKYDNHKQNYIRYIEGMEIIETFKAALIFLSRENQKNLFER